ncbi:MAG: extracellular solute-binding protein [Deltaproteobacteria bacterium]|nr:extracellular solute-binding protein [Deltaproteobacteria bacterium]
MKFLVAVFALLVACSEPKGVVLWHAYNGDERVALEATATAWNTAHPDQPVTLVAVPYDAFADKLSSAIPRGNGPDLFIYPQDRIGDWAAAGVIEPLEFWVDDARADRFTEQSLGAMAYHGSLWGLPMTVKSLVLYYRSDLAPEPPKTTADLLALAGKLRDRHVFAVAYPSPDLYAHAMWLHGFGGRVMDDDGALTIATPQATQAMTFARSLVAQGVAPEDAQGPLIASMFNDGRAATVVSGPWFIPDIGRNVPWHVTTLPIVSETGKPAAPFVTAEGILMSARAKDKDAAFAVMDFLSGDASAVVRAKAGHQVVPNIHAYDDKELAGDPTVAVFRAQLQHVVPMPNDPNMRRVWTPYRTALGEVLAGRDDPGASLNALQREIEKYTDKK